jgi:hypothetical protein
MRCAEMMLHNIASLNRGIFLPSVALGYKTFSLYRYAQFTDYSLSPEISKVEFENSYVYPYRIASAESHIQASPLVCCVVASSSVYVDSLYFVMLDVMLITFFWQRNLKILTLVFESYLRTQELWTFYVVSVFKY